MKVNGYEVQSELVLSMNHIIFGDSWLLTAEVNQPRHCVVYPFDDCGFRVLIDKDDPPDTSMFSPSFKKCVDLAFKLGVNWLRLDRDFPENEASEYLDVHDW